LNASQLKAVFDKYYKAPLEAWEYFLSFTEEKTFNKNEKIKEADKRARFGYFLVEGAVGLFIQNDNQRICLDLFLENNFFADDISLMNGLSSPIEIIALETTSTLRIGKTQIDTLKQTPMGMMLFSVGDQKALIEKQQHQMDLMTKTAEQRYTELLQNKPELLQRISQKDIASYLGISTQSLSRIRRKIQIS